MYNRLLFILIILSLAALCSIFAGTTGKLSGRVTDAETKEPLPGVNVLIEGTTMGAATDVDGEYIINNVPPGSYNVICSAIGFQQKKYVNVKVVVDMTTRIDFIMTKEAIAVQEVVVEAQAPLVRRDLSSSYTSVDATQIKALPVESVTQILSLQAGVIQGTGGELHIRGGRSNEIAYSVNGVSIVNPFYNGRMVSVATNAIQELSVVSGTFNAEYGNALSGIVNTVTKEGGNRLIGSFSYYTGDQLSPREETYYYIDHFNWSNNYVMETSLGGPIPYFENDLKFFVSGRYEWDQGRFYGIREHNTTDSVYKDKLDPNDIRVAMTGDKATVSMNPNWELSATGKLTFKVMPEMKINYDVLYSKSQAKSYSHDWKYNPDGLPTGYEWGLMNSLEIRHALSNTTFYVLQGFYNFNDYKSYLYPLLDKNNKPVDYHPGMNYRDYHADTRYQPDHKTIPAANYTFLAGGTSNGHYYQRANTIGGRFDITSQVTKNHEVKFGLSGKQHTLDYESFTVRCDSQTYRTPTILSPTSAYHDLYSREPKEFSAYIQDKMEFESFIMNVGVRYDYFESNSKYSTNTFYPTPNSPTLPPYIDENSLLANAGAKHQVSPRLGISFPITDRGIIHFSYGHFYQMPPFAYLYSNPDFKYSFQTGYPTFGNANLNPEKTITYELGLQQQLAQDIAFNVTGFYKDVRDLLALQQIRISGDETYYKYVNKDYGNIKGILFSFTKRRTATDPLSATLDYTFQVAEGNETGADAFFLDLFSGRQSEKIPVPLEWDQSHTLNATVSVGEIGNWNATLVGRLGTGLPYTPQLFYNQVYLETNSGRKPSQARVDLLAEKIIDLGGIYCTIFLKVFNLFDALIERVIYNDTGRSTYTLTKSQGSAMETDKIAERVPGVHPTSDYFNRPNYYGAPREVKLGMSIEIR